MTAITINDLVESKELDQIAMAEVAGGLRFHYHIHWHKGWLGIRYPHLHSHKHPQRIDIIKPSTKVFANYPA